MRIPSWGTLRSNTPNQTPQIGDGSLSLALSRSMGPQPINLDSNARIFGAVIERESQSHRPFPSPILLLLLLRSSANNCMHPERGRARERQGIFSREKRSSGWGFHSSRRHRVKRKCIHERRRRRHVAVRRVDLCFVRISLSISSLDIIASLFLSLSFATILGCRCCGCHRMRSPLSLPLFVRHIPQLKSRSQRRRRRLFYVGENSLLRNLLTPSSFGEDEREREGGRETAISVVGPEGTNESVLWSSERFR